MFSAASSAIRGALKLPAAAPDPFVDLDNVYRAATDPREAVCLEALIDSARAEILTYHLATRPANTTKNYAPKQKEWSVSLACIGSLSKHPTDRETHRRGAKSMPGRKGASICRVIGSMRGSSSSSLGNR